jgi:hypothetical protein
MFLRVLMKFPNIRFHKKISFVFVDFYRLTDRCGIFFSFTDMQNIPSTLENIPRTNKYFHPLSHFIRVEIFASVSLGQQF